MGKAKDYYQYQEFELDFYYMDQLKTISHKTLEDVEAKENDLLNLFCLFLENQGYLDIDWRAEEPFAIDEFKKSKQYSNWKDVLKKLKL